MKKLMFAAAAVAAGVAVADVTSANIVGYNTCSEMQTSATEQKLNMMAIPFSAVDGKGISLNDLVFSNPKASSRATQADQILLWVYSDKSQKYEYEYWYRKSTGWFAVSGGADFDVAYPNGLPAGTTFWYNAYKKTGAETLTTSGAVCEDQQVVRNVLRDSLNFVSFPYPVALKLNDKTQADWGTAVASSRATQADQIMLWVYNAQTDKYEYEYYYLKSSGWTAVSGGNAFEINHPNGVTVGTGFWYKAYKKSGSTDFDITFKSPLAKAAE